MRKLLLTWTCCALALTACATKSASTTTTTGNAGTPPPAPVARPTPAPAPRVEPALEPLDFGPIFFSLDSSRLTPDSQRTLERLAEAMQRQPGSRVTISGHTCELGTSEYNLALGQQRAAVTRDYLVRLGVEPSRIQLVSYGEESPRVAGNTEEAWQQNRRSEFSFTLMQAQQGGR
jgi:peptidoglycan-associated lipoprotein